MSGSADTPARGVALDQVAGITQLPVNLARQGCLGQTRTDIGRDIHHRHWMIELSLASVRECYGWHFGSSCLKNFTRKQKKAQCALLVCALLFATFSR